MDTDESGTKWPEGDPEVINKMLTKAQVKAIEYVLAKLPGYGEYLYSWRVEVVPGETVNLGTFTYTTTASVFLFAETRVEGDNGKNALILCRENYLFTFGPRGKITQLASRNERRRTGITKNFR